MIPQTPTERAVFDVLEAAAEAGAPCPENWQIADDAGLPISAATASACVHYLDAKGWITVTREGGRGWRMVTIEQTGARTEMGGPAAVRRTAATNREAESLRREAPEPEARDACWRCGTRPQFAAEFGCPRCRHGAQAPPAPPRPLFRGRAMVC
jgi:hypothetical protein